MGTWREPHKVNSLSLGPGRQEQDFILEKGVNLKLNRSNSSMRQRSRIHEGTVLEASWFQGCRHFGDRFPSPHPSM